MLVKIPELKQKNGKRILHGGIIRIPSRGLVLVRGRNGSGKTTLAKEIFRQKPGLFAMLCQENNLVMGNLSVLENIDMFQGRSPEILAFLAKNGLSHLLSKPSGGLSGGERRLVSVLRVLFSPRRFLILDEPSNDVDDRTFGILYRLIREFSSEKSILIVSHDKRFSASDMSYEIAGQTLNQGYFCQVGPESEDAADVGDANKPELDAGLAPFKKEKRNPIFLFHGLLMFLIFGYSVISGVPSEPALDYGKYEPGTYRVASMLGTDLLPFNDTDGMNTILLKAALKPNKLAYIQNQSQNPDEIGLGLEFSEETVSGVFPLEYYDPEARRYQTIQRRMESLLAEAAGIPDTSVAFRGVLAEELPLEADNRPRAEIPVDADKTAWDSVLAPYGYEVDQRGAPGSGLALDFSQALYMKALEESGKPETFLVDAVVTKRKNIGFFEFLQQNGLMDKAYLIQGYDVYKAFDEANRFYQWFIAIRGLVLYLILGFLCLAGILYLFERSRLKEYQMLFYYGYSVMDLRARQAQAYLVQWMNPALAVCSCLAGIALLSVYESVLVAGAVVPYAAFVRGSWSIPCAGVRKMLERRIR